METEIHKPKHIELLEKESPLEFIKHILSLQVSKLIMTEWKNLKPADLLPWVILWKELSASTDEDAASMLKGMFEEG